MLKLNTKKYIKAALLIIVMSVPFMARAALFGPSNYNECILENMKGVTSNSAALAIKQACRSKFPPKNNTDPSEFIKKYSVTAEDINQVQINSIGLDNNYLYFEIYNGIKDGTLTTITFRYRIIPKDNLPLPWSKPENYNFSDGFGDPIKPLSYGRIYPKYDTKKLPNSFSVDVKILDLKGSKL
jgi:hypothetical protein